MIYMVTLDGGKFCRWTYGDLTSESLPHSAPFHGLHWRQSNCSCAVWLDTQDRYCAYVGNQSTKVLRHSTHQSTAANVNSFSVHGGLWCCNVQVTLKIELCGTLGAYRPSFVLLSWTCWPYPFIPLSSSARKFVYWAAQILLRVTYKPVTGAGRGTVRGYLIQLISQPWNVSDLSRG